jgi:phosphatidylglycerol:prolipoprotein diacylglycerol transferase
MRPVLLSLRIGSRELALHTYGVLIAAGLAVGIAVAYREARRRGVDGGRVLDLAFWITVTGLLGSRVAYGIVNAREFARLCTTGDEAARDVWRIAVDCTRIVQVWEGGLVFYGGVAAAAVAVALYARRQLWGFWQVGDLFAPGLAVGHALGRLGCFAAGCCFGKPAGGAWGAEFPRGSVAFDELASLGEVAPGASLTPPLHPVQLYEAAGELAIFVALLALQPRLRRRPGALLLTYGALYAALRFAVELYRGDLARGYVVALVTPRLSSFLHLPPGEPVLLSVGQLASVAVLLLTAAAFARRRRSAWASPDPRTPAP